MTTFTAVFRTPGYSAEYEFDAPTPEKALALARRFCDEHLDEIAFEPCEFQLVTEIAINNVTGDECALWLADGTRLELAAPRMFAALKQALAALNAVPRFKVPGLTTDSYGIAALCEKAIRQAAPNDGGGP